MPKSSEKFGKRGIRLKRGRGCLVGITCGMPGTCWPLLPPGADPTCPLALPPTFAPTPPGGMGGGGGATIEDCVPELLKPGGRGGGRGGPANRKYRIDYHYPKNVKNYFTISYD